ncbi:MAG: hypothetical protein AAF098_05725 [Pseudomonadota bacterium]
MFKHWRYRLEKGRPHLILLIGLLVIIIAISVAGGVVVYLTGAGSGLAQSIWWTFLHITDPGYLGDDDGAITATLGTLFTILGMITFMAGLVGILTSLITSGLKHLREGGAPVAFKDHIVIVGWNSRIFTLVADLLHASAHHEIAILGPIEKDDAEKQLERRVFDPIENSEGARAARLARGNVVYRQGNSGVEHDLNRVSTREASRFVLLTGPTDVADRAVDVAQIRTLYSVERAHARPVDDKQRFTTVVEFASERFRSHAFYALQLDPRQDTWVGYYEEQLQKRGQRSFLPVPNRFNSVNDMTAVNPDQVVSRVLVQCAIQPFLSGIYDELFSFRGKELFLLSPSTEFKRLWDEARALAAERRPAFLYARTSGGMIVGSVNQQGYHFDPNGWEALDEGDQLLILGDRSELKPRTTPSAHQSSGELCAVEVSPMESGYRVLVLGSNRRLPIILEQFSDYSEQYTQTSVEIDIVANSEDISRLAASEHLRVNHHKMDFTNWEVLGALLEKEEPYDTIILLAEDLDIDDPELDARVTLVLVMLRAFRDDAHWSDRLAQASLVAEVRDPSNRNILRQERLAGDIIVGDEYVSGFIAQVCIDHRLEELYREILDYGHYEIYARKIQPSSDKITFGCLIESCADRGETAIGILRLEGSNRASPRLAPEIDLLLSDGDLALVIARH